MQAREVFKFKFIIDVKNTRNMHFYNLVVLDVRAL